MRIALCAASALVAAAVAAPARATLFDFASADQITTPLTITADGITASVSSPSDPAFDVADLSGIVVSFGPVALFAPGILPPPAPQLDIVFSAPVSNVSFGFAIEDSDTPSALDAVFFDGAAQVGSASFTGALLAGGSFPEGLVTFAGPVTAIVLSDADVAGYAIGAITATAAVVATPEPASLGLLAVAGAVAAVARRRRHA